MSFHFFGVHHGARMCGSIVSIFCCSEWELAKEDESITCACCSCSESTLYPFVYGVVSGKGLHPGD